MNVNLNYANDYFVTIVFTDYDIHSCRLLLLIGQEAFYSTVAPYKILAQFKKSTRIERHSTYVLVFKNNGTDYIKLLPHSPIKL